MGSTGDQTEIIPADVSDEEANMMAMELVCASALPMVLKTAIELDLLEIMAKAGPGALMSSEEVASKLPTTNPDAPVMLDRIFRLLASYSVLSYSSRTLPDDGKVERLYGLGPVCKFLTKNKDGVSLSGLSLLNQSKVIMESWHFLKDAVLEGGIPFHMNKGMTAFQYFATDPGLNKIFNEGMFDHSTIDMKKILEIYDSFEGLKTLVDVGGSTGVALSMIVSKYPNIKGINFDLPHVIENAPTYPGVEHIGGDMFVCALVQRICHGWGDEHYLKFLKKCYEALPDNGKVIVIDVILPEHPDQSLSTKVGVLSDCIMLCNNPGGKERTVKQFEALAKAAGFQGFQVKCSVFGTHIMEFIKSM